MIRNPIEYTIVSVLAEEQTTNDLCKLVNTKLQDGYEPLGAPFQCEGRLAQALIRKPETREKMAVGHV